MSRVWLIIGVIYSLLLSLSEGQVDHASTPSAFPHVRLQIGAPTGGHTYRIGETIRLELAFSTNGPPQLQLLPGFSQRGVTLDRVAVEPSSGWEDPLADFLRLCPPVLQGGLVDERLLSTDPVKIPLILNEWVRFQSTGDYLVTVDSRRVTSINAGRNLPQPSVESDKFRLHIIPASKDAQSRTLEDAMRVLNSPESTSREQQEQRRNAIDAVRFLGTDEAARAMTQLLASQPYSDQLLAGLAGSPARETVAREMRRLLVDPHFPVVREFLWTLSIVESPAGARAGAAARQSALAAQLREELRAALRHKIGQAQTISSVTIDSMP